MGRPIAAVTGASRGIGRATVWELAQSGYRVFALARSESELRQLEEEARDRGFDVRAIVMDIESDTSRDAAVSAIFADTHGHGVDVLVNNAGYGQLGPLEEVPIRKFRRQMEVNVVGLLAFSQPFIAPMRTRGAGRIVNISSAAGRTATPFMGPYNASKFALEGLSDALRLELYPFGVHVILIAPGPIRTSFGEASRQASEVTPSSSYSSFMSTWQATHAKSNVFSRSPETVARVVVRAVRARRPRPRYTITLTAKVGAVTRRLVPDRVTDWALRRAAGLHRTEQ